MNPTATQTLCSTCPCFLEYRAPFYVCPECERSYTQAEYDDLVARYRQHAESVIAAGIRRWL